MPTKREWLIEHGLAKPNSRGRLSLVALAELHKAEQAGMVFDSESSRRAVKDRPVDYDARAIRRWAHRQGIKLGERGRIPEDIVKQYFADSQDTENRPDPAAHVAEIVNRDKVRPNTMAEAFARRKPEDPEFISEPRVVLTSCGKCKEGISYCRCSGGPYAPGWMGGEKATLID
jgi:hypothetical protein